MTKKVKRIEPEPAHELVIFETKEEKQNKTVDKYSFETIDQEDKIILKNQFIPFTAHYRYTISLYHLHL